MISVPAHLWAVPAYLPYLQPPLTDAMVVDAETHLDVRLPRAYVAALRLQNGGYLRTQHHPATQVDCLWGIGPGFPSILDHDWSEIRGHMQANGITTPAGLGDLVPFSGDGHLYVCFDYRRSGRQAEPSVSLIDVESFDTDEVLAADVDTFLAALERREDELGVVTDLDLAGVSEALGAAFGCRFEAIAEDDIGYPGYAVLRGRIGPLEEPGAPRAGAWVCLAPNLVPRGFVRQGEPHVEAHRHLLRELAPRSPADLDCPVLLALSGSDEVVATALSRSPLPLRRLR